MPLEFKGTVMKVGNGLLITIPKPICDGFGIKKGDTLTMKVTDDTIEIPVALKKSAVQDKEIRKLK